MTTLYLHIGLPKTGTSSIQWLVSHNYEKLLDQGLLYPLSGRMKDGKNCHYKLSNRLTWQHYKLAAPLRWIKGPESLSDKVLNSYLEKIKVLEDEIAKKSPNKILISDDNFTWLSPESIKWLHDIFLKNYKVKILIYLRRQDDFIISFYTQQTKRRKTIKDICEYIEDFKYLLNYYNLVKPWTETFGKENIIIKPFEKEQFLNNNLRDDFFASINFLAENYDFLSEKEINVRPNIKTIKIMAFLNKINSKYPYVFKRKTVDLYFSKVFNRLLDGNSKITKLIFKIPDWLISEELMSFQQRIELMKEFEESNQKVAREYLNRPDGKLFYSFPSVSE